MKVPLLAAVCLLVSLLVTACSGDSDNESDANSAAPETSASATLSADQEAVKEVLVQSLLDPRCDLMTDDYLVKLSVFGDATPDEACEQWKNGWVEPQFGEDDIIVSDIEVNGDVATAVVGSDYINVTTTYQLTRVDGSWKVSCDDFTCDDLQPSAEVS